MAVEYTWKLTGLRKQHADDLLHVVVGTQWQIEGTDSEGYVGTFSGGTPFEINEVDRDNFVPFSELTENTVLGWVKSYVSGSDSPHPHYWAHITEMIQKHIDNQKYEHSEIGPKNFPWNPTSGSNETDAPPV